MLDLYDDKPIVACSSGLVTNSAIGLIRISGFSDLSVLRKYFSKDISKFKPKSSYLVNVVDGNKQLDNVVAVFYQGPNSYNGENILELSVHGNQLNIQNIIQLFTKSGEIRTAKEGEFTYRALKNNKVSLSQVEGLDLLLNANSNLMLEQGLETLQGDLHDQYKSLYDSFMKLKSSVELSIDFAEDIGDDELQSLLNRTRQEVGSIISSLYQRTRSNISSLTSPDVVLIGQTNAGKSSLFNKLLKNNRSIVSNIAGTTRDYVSENLFIEGTNFRLVDTAGLRDTFDSIEKIGIERSYDLLRKAFFKILVVNPKETNFDDYKLIKDENFDLVIFSHGNEVSREEVEVVFKHLPPSKTVIVVDFETDSFRPYQLNKKNGPMGAVELGPIEPKKNGPMGAAELGPIEPNKNGPMGAVELGPIEPKISGPMGALWDSHVVNEIGLKYSNLTSDGPIMIERHRQVIAEIHDKYQQFQEVTRDIADVAIISSELNLLGNKVGELIGLIRPDDILNNIFSNFCIGK